MASTVSVLLVIAHPDDECMFFGPTIQSLRGRQFDVHVLCLSNGNAGGRGTERAAELKQACKVLQVEPENVFIVNDSRLQDGPDTQWSPNVIFQVVRDHLRQCEYQLVLTFDHHGVSGHVNHRQTSAGVRQLAEIARQQLLAKPHFMMLESVGLLRKFLGPLEAWLAQAMRPWTSPDGLHVCLSDNLLVIRSALQQHLSQWLWYRQFFIVFSRYSYINTWKPMLS